MNSLLKLIFTINDYYATQPIGISLYGITEKIVCGPLQLTILLDSSTMLVSTALCLLLIVSGNVGQRLPISYNGRTVPSDEPGTNSTRACPATSELLRANIKQDLRALINNSVLPILMSGNQTSNGSSIYGNGFGSCGCGGPGWRRVVYLNMSDPTQSCPPNWTLISTPRRSCGRSTGTSDYTDSCCCDSATFSVQGMQYSQVCGRIIAYQKGHPQGFFLENYNAGIDRQTINGPYVDGVSLTYGNPRQHVWTFAGTLDENTPQGGQSACPCSSIAFSPTTVNVPSFVGNDYFCETGVPTGQTYGTQFYGDDPLWDGQGCGPTSTCCTFNSPPWFCKQLPRSTSDTLEIRMCAIQDVAAEGTPIELAEIFVR